MPGGWMLGPAPYTSLLRWCGHPNIKEFAYSNDKTIICKSEETLQKLIAITIYISNTIGKNSISKTETEDCSMD